MTAREAILAAIQPAARWLPEAPEFAPLPVALAGEPGLPARFEAEARRSDAEVEAFSTREAALDRLKALCQGERLFCWDSPWVPAGLGSPAATPMEASLGVTACDFAIADTGTLALVAGPGKPRLASLSVRTHVALVDPTQLVADLPSALARVEALDAPAHINLITGPSRTADIEMTLTRGVHGPKRLIILLAPWMQMERKPAA